MPLQYSKKVMQHFLRPKNVGIIKQADGIGKVGNIFCGDILWLYIKVGGKKGKEIIKDIKFQTLGCPAAIASSSVITELAKGKTVEKAMAITNKDIIKVLGKLPATKYHCSLLGEEALSEAIHDYFKKHKKSIPAKLKKKHKRLKQLEKKFEKRFGKYLKI